MAGISAEEAHKRLESITTKDEFKALVNELSVDVKGVNPGAKTLFYSGKIIQNGVLVDTATIAAGLVDDPNIRLIDNTEADKFLASIYIEYPKYRVLNLHFSCA